MCNSEKTALISNELTARRAQRHVKSPTPVAPGRTTHPAMQPRTSATLYINPWELLLGLSKEAHLCF